MKTTQHLFIAFLFLVIPFFTSQDLHAQTDNQTQTVSGSALKNFDETKSVFKLEEEQLSNKNGFLRFSVLTGYREGVKTSYEKDKTVFKVYNNPTTGTRRMVMYNVTIPEMLNLFQIDPDKLILQVKNPSKYMYKPEYGDIAAWKQKNTFCYELELPAGVFSGNTINDVKTYLSVSFGATLSSEKRMSTDNQRYGLAAGQPNREVEVLVLTELK